MASIDENRVDYLISQAEKLKQEGNDFFKAKEYERANTRYHRSLAFLTGIPGRESESNSMLKMASQNSSRLSVEDNLKFDNLESLIRMNISTVYIKLSEKAKSESSASTSKITYSEYLRKALKSAQDSLRLNPSYSKAKLRVIEALVNLKQYDNALRNIEELENDLNNISENKDCEDSAKKAQENENLLNQVKKYRLLINKNLQEEKNKQKKAFANIFDRSRED